MNDHFRGIVPEEQWRNDLLNELRQIRMLLERNAQAVEQPAETKPRRTRQKRSG